MNNEFDLDIIASVKASIAAKKARDEKAIQDLEEKRSLAYEKHMIYFFEQLVNFVKDEIPRRLNNGGTSIIDGKTFICSTRLPFHPIDDDIIIDVNKFVSKIDGMIQSDQRFIIKRDQLLSETGILLTFDNLEYYSDDDDIYRYPDNLREQFKNGSFYFSASF